jgi:hypothetical protein
VLGRQEVIIGALGFGGRLKFLFFLPGTLCSSIMFPLEFQFCSDVDELQRHGYFLSSQFSQHSTDFWPLHIVSARKLNFKQVQFS